MPDGPLMLLIEGLGDPRYTVTDGCRWDSNSVVLGRADAVAQESDAAMLSIVADGLRPWGGGDRLILFAPEPWASFWPYDEPEAGATSMTTVPDLYWGSGPLIDGSRGDVATAYQSSPGDEDSPIQSWILVAAGEAAPFTMVDGATTEVRATLAPLAADHELSFAIEQDAFAALGPGRAGIAFDGAAVTLNRDPGGRPRLQRWDRRSTQRVGSTDARGSPGARPSPLRGSVPGGVGSRGLRLELVRAAGRGAVREHVSRRLVPTDYGRSSRSRLAAFTAEVGDELMIPEGILAPGETVQFSVGAYERYGWVTFDSPTIVVE